MYQILTTLHHLHCYHPGPSHCHLSSGLFPLLPRFSFLLPLSSFLRPFPLNTAGTVILSRVRVISAPNLPVPSHFTQDKRQVFAMIYKAFHSLAKVPHDLTPTHQHDLSDLLTYSSPLGCHTPATGLFAATLNYQVCSHFRALTSFIILPGLHFPKLSVCQPLFRYHLHCEAFHNHPLLHCSVHPQYYPFSFSFFFP